jgi:NAD-dependent dihydropyrimidine dehydrogenase PreA subunit
MTHVIAEPCVGTKDKACVAACPVSCIYEAPELLVIHPDECIDCGACVDPCPVKAIFPLDDLPEKWKDYTAKNADWFKTGETRTPATPK